MIDDTTYEIVKVMAWCKDNLHGNWVYYEARTGKDPRLLYHVEAILHFENRFDQRYYISFENEADYCLFYLTWG